MDAGVDLENRGTDALSEHFKLCLIDQGDMAAADPVLTETIKELDTLTEFLASSSLMSVDRSVEDLPCEKPALELLPQQLPLLLGPLHEAWFS